MSRGRSNTGGNRRSTQHEILQQQQERLHEQQQQMQETIERVLSMQGDLQRSIFQDSTNVGPTIDSRLDHMSERIESIMQQIQPQQTATATVNTTSTERDLDRPHIIVNGRRKVTRLTPTALIAFLREHLYQTDEEANNAYNNVHDAGLMAISNMRQSLGLTNYGVLYQSIDQQIKKEHARDLERTSAALGVAIDRCKDGWFAKHMLAYLWGNKSQYILRRPVQVRLKLMINIVTLICHAYRTIKAITATAALMKTSQSTTGYGTRASRVLKGFLGAIADSCINF